MGWQLLGGRGRSKSNTNTPNAGHMRDEDVTRNPSQRACPGQRPALVTEVMICKDVGSAARERPGANGFANETMWDRGDAAHLWRRLRTHRPGRRDVPTLPRRARRTSFF